MRIRLIEEPEGPRYTCAEHGCDMTFEDGDEYGAIYICPVEGCKTRKTVGMSNHEVWRQEQGVGGFH